MTERDAKLEALSNQFSEHISAVKGTLELIDASVEEDDLHNLVLKGLKRMDELQKLSGELFALIRACLERLGENKK